MELDGIFNGIFSSIVLAKTIMNPDKSSRAAQTKMRRPNSSVLNSARVGSRILGALPDTDLVNKHSFRPFSERLHTSDGARPFSRFPVDFARFVSLAVLRCWSF